MVVSPRVFNMNGAAETARSRQRVAARSCARCATFWVSSMTVLRRSASAFRVSRLDD
ncbi:hypothetical protein JQ616_38050 [Bradyrhizobium tropiciagri]|nr:hypothetical protein [Bradyrhizobium tropiciagri]